MPGYLAKNDHLSDLWLKTQELCDLATCSGLSGTVRGPPGDRASVPRPLSAWVGFPSQGLCLLSSSGRACPWVQLISRRLWILNLLRGSEGCRTGVGSPWHDFISGFGCSLGCRAPWLETAISHTSLPRSVRVGVREPGAPSPRALSPFWGGP